MAKVTPTSTTITLSPLRLYARHGLHEQERVVGGWFLVSVEATLSGMPQACLTDNVDDTLDYALMASVVKREMSIPSRMLEHVAYRIGNALLAISPPIARLTVKVEKLNPPLAAECPSASVSLTFE